MACRAMSIAGRKHIVGKGREAWMNEECMLGWGEHLERRLGPLLHWVNIFGIFS